ncbi:MAG: hypothetical protein AB1782_07110 [Cyanobacteriota bacterium]
MRNISVLEYAELVKLSVKTIYKKIKKGEIPYIVEGGKRFITVDDAEYYQLMENQANSPLEQNEVKRDFQENDYVQDIEVIDDLPGDKKYNIVSMENNTFEHLILNITELSDKRAKTFEETILRLQEEYYESRTENKRLNQELINLTNKLVEAEIAFRVGEIRVKELEKILTKKEESIEENNNYIQELKLEIKSLELNNKNINSEKENLNLKNDELMREINTLKEKIEKSKLNKSNNLWLNKKL